MSDHEQKDCCVTALGTCATPAPDRRGQGGARTTLTAVLLGVVASACCWLPLLLAALGVAGGAVGAGVAFLRPWALGALGLLLVGLVSWWAFKRYAGPANPEACCAVVPKFPFVPFLALLLSLIGAYAAPRLLHPGQGSVANHPTPSMPQGAFTWVLATPQFDCAPCAGTLPQRMAETPGVASVHMDFEARQTRITFQAGADPAGILARWERELGFTGKVLERRQG